MVINKIKLSCFGCFVFVSLVGELSVNCYYWLFGRSCWISVKRVGYFVLLLEFNKNGRLFFSFYLFCFTDIKVCAPFATFYVVE